MRLLWLPDVLRAAGLTVREVAGWEKRGAADWGPDTSNPAYRMPLRGIVCHATAGARNGSASGEIGVLINGSPSAPPPISQLYIARDGVWHVVASGRCNHALVGWGGPLKGWGNYQLLGIEGGNDNRGEPWPKAQLDSYQRGVAALCRKLDLPASRVAAHREHQPYPPPAGQTSTKSDPHGIDMTTFRRRVATLIEEDDMSAEDLLAAEVDMYDEGGKKRWWSGQIIGKDRISVNSALQYAAASLYYTRDEVVSRLKAAEKRDAALLAAVGALGEGTDVEAVVRRELEASEARERAEREVELAPLHEALEQASTERAELAELIGQAQSGQLAAEEVVAEIGRRLARAEPSG